VFYSSYFLNPFVNIIKSECLRKSDTGDGDTSPILLIFLYVVGTYENSIP